MAASASTPSFHDLVALHAAIDGDLLLLKCMASEVNLHEAKDEKGRGVLLLAAAKGHLELCRFLVDELGLDVNCMSAGASPVHVAAGYGHKSVLRYLLDRGADPGMLDWEGSSRLLCAVIGGNCQAVRLVLSKGVDVDPPDYLGTPLLAAALNKHVQVIKILLEHGADAGADVNFVAPSGRSILMEATDAGLVDIVKFLLEAGADPNLVDKDGKIPIMYAAVNWQRELVEILFPKTRPVPSVPDWSVDGIITSAKDLLFNAHDAGVVEERIADAKSQGKEAFAKGDYVTAAYFYGLAMRKDSSDAILFANRSLCWLRLREGDRALSDAHRCILMRPHWSKAWYPQGAALSFLKAYKGAVGAFKQALKLDPASDEIKKALREAIAGMDGDAASMGQWNP